MITFFGMPSRSSGIIRGHQISQEIGGNFIDKNSHRLVSGKNTIYDTCIFIRDINISDAKKMRSQGRKIGYDLLDRPVADIHRVQRNDNKDCADIDWKRYINENIDFYIVNNTCAKEKLKKVKLSHHKIYVIPHPVITNSIYDNVYDYKKNPINIGYLGMPDQISKKLEIDSFCKNNGLNLCLENYSTRNECIDFLKGVDIGLVFLEKNMTTDYVLKYKPNVKLTNFQAFGIPSVICSYSSYLEFSVENSYLKADTVNEVFDSILKIKNSEKIRKNISELSYKSANHYTLKNIKNLYLKAIEEMK